MAAFEKTTPRRTLVEFYDSEYLENIISLLRGNYSDVVFIFFSRANEPTEYDRRALSEYIRNNFGFSPRFREISENTVECALKSFRDLISDGGAYDFDITGGSTVFIAAAGALAVDNGGKRIFLHEYDPATGKRIFAYPENLTVTGERNGRLTVDHVLALRGIEIRHKQHAIRYRLEQDNLRGEVLRLWNAIRADLKAWNSFCCTAAHIEQGRYSSSVDKRIPVNQMANYDRLLGKLRGNGIISDLHEYRDGDKIELSYRLNVPESALFLYDKAGNILEMLTYVAAVDSGCFADCCTGISLDWDDSNRREDSGAYNEIDTVLTCGHIPCFISCKNTKITNEFMYEIMVMARHYGGKYAVPGLVCTTECNGADHGRAKEMGVVLIDGIASMTVEEYSRKLVSAFGGK